MNPTRLLPGLALASALCTALPFSTAIAQGATATAVAHTALSVAASPFTQSVPAGTDLTPGANLGVNAGPAYASGGADLVVSLVQQPILTYRIDAEAQSFPGSLPSPTCSYGGETRLVITPQGGPLVGILRVTYSYFASFGTGSGNAAIDIGNDGTIDWTNAATGTPQVFEATVVQSGPLVIRTITSAGVGPGFGTTSIRDGDLTVEFFPTSFAATAVAHTALSASSGGNSQSLPAGTDLASGVSLSALAPSPMFISGSAGLGVSLTTAPSFSYEVSNTASSSPSIPPGGGFPPTSTSSGQTLLTISPLAGYLQGRLRITFSWFPLGTAGSASIDLGNDGIVDWVGSGAGSNPQIHEVPIGQTSPLLVRTITSASASSGSGTASVDLVIEYIETASWPEAGDAGQTRPTAQVPRGIGPLESITGTLGANDCDLYWIHIDDPSTFQATTDGGAAFDTQLWLFDRRGYGVTHNDDNPLGGLHSRLTSQFVRTAGNYLLAVTAYDRDAVSAAGEIWNDGPLSAERQPDGPGAGLPLMNWSGVPLHAGAYTIFLTGATFPDLGRLIAVDGNRSLYSLDPATGAKTLIGTVSNNVGSPRDLAYDPVRGALYLTATGPSALYTLDVATGAATLVGPYVPGGNTWDMSIEYDISTGRLYGATNSTLYQLDTTTGLATAIGNTGFGLFSSASLLHDPTDNRFYASTAGNLYSVDRGNGAATLIGPLGTGFSGDTTRSAATGIVYLVDYDDDTLYSLDTATGTATAIGPTGPGLLLGMVHIPSRSGVADYGTGCAGQGGVTPLLRAVGTFPHTGAMTYELSGAAPLSLGFFAFGDDTVWIPLPFPGACPLHISPLLLIDGLFVTGPGGPGSGSGSFTVPLAPSAMGLELTAQGVVLENIDLGQLRTSNGVLILQ